MKQNIRNPAYASSFHFEIQIYRCHLISFWINSKSTLFLNAVFTRLVWLAVHQFAYKRCLIRDLAGSSSHYPSANNTDLIGQYLWRILEADFRYYATFTLHKYTFNLFILFHFVEWIRSVYIVNKRRVYVYLNYENVLILERNIHRNIIDIKIVEIRKLYLFKHT
jgi:hypothetical protein